MKKNEILKRLCIDESSAETASGSGAQDDTKANSKPPLFRIQVVKRPTVPANSNKPSAASEETQQQSKTNGPGAALQSLLQNYYSDDDNDE